jgi:LysR family transcriptional regulator, cys regulon transcriptional activator
LKLQQLRFLAAIAQSGLNITAAATRLRASQPAVSRQLKLLEEELGFDLFARNGRTLVKVTPFGQQVIDRALRILHEARVIRRIGDDFRDEAHGTLSIGTTHTQARYVLPRVVQMFRAKYPAVRLHLHQGTSEQIAGLAKLDGIDFAIATGAHELFPQYVLLPCYHWFRRIVVPRDHVLGRIQRPTLTQLANFPIVTYVFNLSGPASLQDLFASEGLVPDIALTARDADVIKTYVRLGLGIGIVADVAVDPVEDADLLSIDASHLFPAHTSWAGFMRGSLLRGYMYDFLHLLAPHLTRRRVELAAVAPTQMEVDAMFARELPKVVSR